MENAQDVSVSKRTALSVTNVAVRVSRETKRRFLGELVRLNKKDFGRPVKADELLALLLNLLADEQRSKLQNATFSNADRLEMRYREYAKKHGRMTKDEFLGKLLTGDIGEEPAVGHKLEDLTKSLESREVMMDNAQEV